MKSVGGEWRRWGNDAERQYDSGRRGSVTRQYDGRAVAWDWFLSCESDEADAGSSFALRDAKAACDKAERAMLAKCGR
jgi:hypothetical protein